jgi:hypothetical protein
MKIYEMPDSTEIYLESTEVLEFVKFQSGASKVRLTPKAFDDLKAVLMEDD